MTIKMFTTARFHLTLRIKRKPALHLLIVSRYLSEKAFCYKFRGENLQEDISKELTGLHKIIYFWTNKGLVL